MEEIVKMCMFIRMLIEIAVTIFLLVMFGLLILKIFVYMITRIF